MEYRMNSILPYFAFIAQGTGVTIGAWIFSGTLSLILGTLLGILSCRHSASPSMRKSIKLYTFVAKGIPAYVQILIAYFVIPSLLGISVSGFMAACGALAFCSIGYVTEIVRSGMNSIPLGQWDACMALGYPFIPTLYQIVAPQLLRIILPALCGELEQLLKSTSLLATIGVTELTRTGMNIISRELNPLPVYGTIACIYLLISALLQLLLYYMERKMHHGHR
jgi:His/Glu/Gln/Arg/opine family amino acid ABC transporter permease subunit